MILLSGFYHDPDPPQRGELIECLRRNAAMKRGHLFARRLLQVLK